MNKSRFEAFSDGVFAFAITLLVLNFALPERALLSNAAMLHELVIQWPKLLAYALSFSVIGIMWQNHHALFRTVARIDRRTVFYNLLLLAATAFIPFATNVLGSRPWFSSAAVLYGLALVASATAYNVMLGHLVRSAAFLPEISQATIAETVRAYRVGLITYVVAMVVGFFFPLVSFALYIMVAVYYLVPRGVDIDLRLDSR